MPWRRLFSPEALVPLHKSDAHEGGRGLLSAAILILVRLVLLVLVLTAVVAGIRFMLVK